MKQLFINNKRVLIDENLYFPFTHTISDLENVNVIGLPSTKSISIPRCPQNDEIFGYIGELTRLNSSNFNNRVGISFNQTKKTIYSLYNDSVLISTGLVLVDNVTNTEYQLTLYDELIKKLEDIGDVNLSDIYYLSDNSGRTIDYPCNSLIVKQISDEFLGIKPVFCVNDTEFDLSKIKCKSYTGSTNTYAIDNVELPTDCTPLQLKTFKCYDIPYAVSVQTLIDNINDYSGTLPNIIVDSELSGLTNDLYILTNKPSTEYLEPSSTSISLSMESQSLTCEGRIIDNTTSDYYEFTNGNYYITLPYQYTFECDKLGDNIYSYYLDENSGFTQYTTSNVSGGTYIGSLWVKLTLFNDFNGDRYSLNPVLQRIDLYNDINCEFTFSSNKQTCVVSGTMLMNIDYYINIISRSAFVKDGNIRTEILFENPENSYNIINLFGEETGVSATTISYTNGLIDFTPIEFRSNDILTSRSILPTITFKDFIINFVKFFNLDLTLVDGNFHIKKKNYYLSSDNLLIDSIDNMYVSTIDFNKMILTTNLPDNGILKKYQNKYNKIYGQQEITTGYSIKNNEKNINFNVGIPVLLKDSNSFAYDRFTKYWNGGYNKHNHGVINGYSNEIVFGYLNQINDSIYVVEDLPEEGGINTNSYDEIDTSFGQYNPFLMVNYESPDDSNKWVWLNQTSSTGSKLTSYYTFSPYLYSGNTITHSLDMNKPVVNYANINDIYYPTSATTYYRYHRKMIIDKYDSNTHLLNVKMYIDGKLDIYKIYNYQNSYYIVSKIIEYDPTQPGIYEVELMRVNNLDNYFKYEFVDEDDEPGGDPEPIFDLYTYKYKVTNNSSQVVYYSIYFDSETYSQIFNSQLSVESMDYEELTPMEEKSMRVTVTITNPTSLVKIGTVETEGGTYRMACYGETNYLDIDDYEILSESNSQVYGSLNITEDYNNNSIIFEVTISDL